MPIFNPNRNNEKNERMTNVIDIIMNIFLSIKIIADKKILVIVIAENIDTITPIPSVNAKPLIKDVPNQKRMRAVIILEIFESRIENQAREKPSFTASAIVR